jgi:hypothetical protein
MFRRQVAELEEARDELRKQPDAKPADDDPRLMDILLEIKAFRETADNIERELKGEAEND